EDGIRDFHVTGVQTCALPTCAEAGRDARVTLIAAGPRPRVLCGPAAPAAAAADALAAWDPTAAHHEFAPALALAGEVAGRDATRSAERRVGGGGAPRGAARDA